MWLVRSEISSSLSTLVDSCTLLLNFCECGILSLMEAPESTLQYKQTGQKRRGKAPKRAVTVLPSVPSQPFPQSPRTQKPSSCCSEQSWPTSQGLPLNPTGLQRTARWGYPVLPEALYYKTTPGGAGESSWWLQTTLYGRSWVLEKLYELWASTPEPERKRLPACSVSLIRGI